MVWAEVKMFARNKALLVIVLSLSALIILFMSVFVKTKLSVPIALCGATDLDGNDVSTIITSTIESTEIVLVDSVEEGKELVRNGSVGMLISIDNDSKQTRAIVYVDTALTTGSLIMDRLHLAKYEYAYSRIIKSCEEFGIKIDNNYFHLIDIQTANVVYTDYTQSLFSVELAVSVSAVLMFSIAYATSRNFETAVGKNMAYLPIGANRSLFSKIIPYFVLGLIQLMVLIPLGQFLFDLTFASNIAILTLFGCVFVLACLSMGLMFGMARSQIVAMLLDFATILLPLLMIFLGTMTIKPLYIEIFLNFSPIYPFVKLFNGLAYNNTILWQPLLYLIMQCVGYYLIALAIYKKRAKS